MILYFTAERAFKPSPDCNGKPTAVVMAFVRLQARTWNGKRD